MSRFILQVTPVIDYSVRELCTRSYHNHPKGCPNYGKRANCPPAAPFYDQVYDLSKPVFAIYNIFKFKSHIERMRACHPEWSEYQLRCVLYWQGSARKALKQQIIEFLQEHKGYGIETCPEAMGVNITETMERVGIMLEWPPKTLTYQVALAGIELELKKKSGLKNGKKLF